MSQYYNNSQEEFEARQRALDLKKLAIPPGQQVLYEDTYTHSVKTFNNQMVQNLTQYSIDPKLYSDAMNDINAYLDKTVGELKKKYLIISIINIILIILTLGLWLLVYIPIMIYLSFQQKKEVEEMTQELDKHFKKMDPTSQMKSNGFEWKIIFISSGIVMRFVNNGGAAVQQSKPVIQ